MAMSKEEVLEKLERAFHYLRKELQYDPPEFHKAGEVHQQIKHAMTVFYNVILPESRPIEESEIYQMGYEKGKAENQPEVDEGFVNKWANEFTAREYRLFGIDSNIEDFKSKLRQMFTEAGVEVSTNPECQKN